MKDETSTSMGPKDAARVAVVPRLALRREEAANAMGVSPRTIDQLIADRTSGFPFVKIGARVIIPTRELTDWVGRLAGKGVKR